MKIFQTEGNKGLVKAWVDGVPFEESKTAVETYKQAHEFLVSLRS